MMSDIIRDIKLDLFKKQSEIIRLQSEAVDGLLKMLLMHMDAAEVDSLPEIGKINDAAEIKAEMEL